METLRAGRREWIGLAVLALPTLLSVDMSVLHLAVPHLAGAVEVAGSLLAQAGQELLDSAREAFTCGLHVVAALGAVVLVVFAVLGMVGLRRGAQAPAEVEPEPVLV